MRHVKAENNAFFFSCLRLAFANPKVFHVFSFGIILNHACFFCLFPLEHNTLYYMSS